IVVMSFTAGSDSTGQYDTRKTRAPAEKKARANPESASAPGLSAAAVLQADSTTQSALSLSCATSLDVSSPSSNAVAVAGSESTSAGSANPFAACSVSPDTRAWVAKYTIRY